MPETGQICTQEPLSQVQDQINELSNVIYNIHDLVCELQNSLVRITKEDVEEDSKAPAFPPLCKLVPLANELRDHRMQIERTRNIVQDLLKQLEL